jgi:GrpB-like predicted nucleotidyltransferase (UPF0157 family)
MVNPLLGACLLRSGWDRPETPMTDRDFHEYSPDWPAAFASERERLLDALGNAGATIEHVGSTAIPGMPGKGIVDILVALPPGTKRERYDSPLRELGYIERPVDRPDPFYTRPAVKPRTHNVHVAQAGSARSRSLIAFRDYLRAHPGEAARYEALKRELADHPGRDWDRYSRTKLGLASELEARAVRWAAARQDT